MAEHLNALFVVTGWAFLVGASGAFFALGVAGVCRWLNWAPINVNVHIYRDGTEEPPQEKI